MLSREDGSCDENPLLSGFDSAVVFCPVRASLDRFQNVWMASARLGQRAHGAAGNRRSAPAAASSEPSQDKPPVDTPSFAL